MSRIGKKCGGFIVIAVPGGGDTNKPVPQWAFRHFDTKDEAVTAAERFVHPLDGYEAYVLPAEAYFFNAAGRHEDAERPGRPRRHRALVK
jgi:hypothetical protein